MCGLVGAFVKSNTFSLSDSELNTFTNMLYCSALRGGDSTGIMTWDGNNVRMVKAAIHPSDFIASETYASFLKGHKNGIKMVFGHTRFATSGKIIAANAHPFRVKDKVVLMHNGNVQSVEGEVVKEHDVDSMALAHSLADRPPSEVFKTFNGAVATIWFDKEAKTLNLFRNYERPLAWTDSATVVFMMSEAKMLDAIVNRAGRLGIRVVEIPTQEHHKFDLNDLTKPASVTRIDKTYPIANYHPVNQHYHRRWDNDWDAPWGDNLDPTPADKPLAPGEYQVWKNGRWEVDRGTHKIYDYKTPGPVKEGKPTGTLRLPFKNLPKEADPWIGLQSVGPFKLGNTVNVVTYDKESYQHGELQRRRVVGVLLKGEKEFLATEIIAGNLTEEKAKELLESEFIKGTIVSIRYNTTWKDITDKYKVWIVNPTPIKVDDSGNVIEEEAEKKEAKAANG